MRRAVQVVLIVAVGLLLGLMSGTAHAQDGGLRLEIAPASESFAPGEPVTLRMTVTNQGAEPCQLAATATGTVHLTSVTRDGEIVAPSFVRSRFIDGFAGAVRSSLRTVRPGESVTFDLAGRPDTIGTHDPLPGGDAIFAEWQLGGDGEHDVSARYRVPAVGGPEEKICAGSTNSATATFEVGAGFDWLRWLLIGGAVLVVVLVVVVFLLVRRRRRRAVAVVLLLVAAMIGIEVGGAQPADAALEKPGIRPATWGDEEYAKWDGALHGCLNGFQTLPGGDPKGIIPDILSNRTPGVYIIPTLGDSETRHDPAPARSSRMDWNMSGQVRNAGDGILLNECSTLYHELYHAYRNMHGQLSEQMCGKTGLKTDEVEATFVENEYRRRHVKPEKGKPNSNIRRYYGGKKLPKSLEDCDPPPPPPKKCIGIPSQLAGSPLVTLNGARRAAQDDCSNDNTAVSNGDPHLTTFDQHSYDFQAVGEFVSAKSGDDFEVQTRQGPVPGLNDRSVSVNSAVAMRVGKDKVGIYLEDGNLAVRVNGKVETLARGSLPLPDGGTLVRRPGFQEYVPDGYTVVWPDDSAAAIDSVGDWGLRLLLAVSDERKGKLTGLLGDFDGDKDNDLLTRDGKPVSATPDHKELYRTFGDSWRISQSESLFSYTAGESTQTFTDGSFPDRLLTVADLTAEERKRAAVACELAGVTDPGLLDQCLLDVARTGQPIFATNASVLQDIMPATEPKPDPDPHDKTIRDGDVVTGSIDSKGERDTFQLDLGDTTEFQFVEQTGDIVIDSAVAGRWKRSLVPDGNEVSGTTPKDRQIVVFRPDDGTGKYSFRFITHKKRPLDVKMGDQIDGKLDVPGRVDVYALDAAGVSSILLVDHKACDYWVGIAEDTPDSSVPTPFPVWSGLPNVPDDACGTIPIDLDPTKRFLLVVWSPEVKTFDYEFRIQKAS